MHTRGELQSPIAGESVSELERSVGQGGQGRGNSRGLPKLHCIGKRSKV